MRRIVVGSSLATGVAIAALAGPSHGSVGPASASAVPRALCLFETMGDYAHVSSTAFEASAHGWWINGNCDATLAVVTVQLQEAARDGSWRNKGTVGRGTVRSGGGSANRVTGRAGCRSGATTRWRSVVDVDVIGIADDPRKLKTKARSIPCRR